MTCGGAHVLWYFLQPGLFADRSRADMASQAIRSAAQNLRRAAELYHARKENAQVRECVEVIAMQMVNVSECARNNDRKGACVMQPGGMVHL
jgi:hypothetical protein